MIDIEKINSIIYTSQLDEDYPYDDWSVKHGAKEMAEYKNQQFNKVCFGFRAVLQHLGVSSEKITELLEVMAKDYTN